MMKKILFTLLTVLLLIGFVSCDFESEDISSVVDVIFKPLIPKTKSLSGAIASEDLVITSYMYQAIASSPSTMKTGQTGSGVWEELIPVGDDGTEFKTTTNFSVGKWTFKIRAYHEDSLLYEGSSSIVLTKTSSNNVVQISLSEKVNTETEKKGSVNFTVKVPHLINGSPSGTMGIVITSESITNFQPVNITPTVNQTAQVTDDELTFVASQELKPGLYIATVSYYEMSDQKKVELCDSVVAFRIVEEITTNVTGRIDETLYASADITIDGFKTILGSLDKDEDDGEYSFEFISAGDGYLTPTTYKWFVDGTLQANQNASTFTYIPNKDYGYHAVTCVSIYSDGQNMSVFSVSEYVDVKEVIKSN